MKEKILNLISAKSKIKLDLGCGSKKLDNDFIGIDLLKDEGVDLCGDAYSILKEFPENSVDFIYCHHFLEHILNLDQMVIEFDRVLKPNGTIKIVVPHFTNPYYYSDYTHKTPFGLYTLSYLVNDNLFKRKVPKYQIKTELELTNVKLTFKSPFYYNYLQRRFIIQTIFNLSNFIKEIYESTFSGLFRCYEIEYHLSKSENKF